MKASTCRHCRKRFDVPTTGRPKKFCSGKCRVASHRLAKREKAGLAVPDGLATQKRWVRHKSKRPLTVTGRAASVTSPRTWSSLKAARESDVGDGLGFVLGDGIGCIDLDDVFDGRGRLDPAAKWLLAELPETWVEVSPSGKGLHIWGFLPEGRGRVVKRRGVSVEVYSQGRYMTVTGVSYGDAPVRLADLSEFVDFVL